MSQDCIKAILFTTYRAGGSAKKFNYGEGGASEKLNAVFRGPLKETTGDQTTYMLETAKILNGRLINKMIGQNIQKGFFPNFEKMVY